jgi:hypothetical protein
MNVVSAQGKFLETYTSLRADWWNYSDKGSYFITICAVSERAFFGKIITGEMISSEIGKIAQKECDKLFEIRSELFCDAFIRMPNHIHVILRISNSPVQTHSLSCSGGSRVSAQAQSDAEASPRSQSDAIASPELQFISHAKINILIRGGIQISGNKTHK